MSSTNAVTTTTIRTNMSALSLKWGDALSMVLPGMVALLAVGPYTPTLNSWLLGLPEAGLGVVAALVVAATAIGGILEAITRVLWVHIFNIRRTVGVDALALLGKNPELLDLYERGVQVTYKWTTFYTNMGTAVLLVSLSRFHHGPDRLTFVNVALLTVTVVLFRAAWVQWTIHVNYIEKVFGRGDDTDAEE